MSDKHQLGGVNGHIVGIILREAVRRATVAIRNERLIFDAHVKESYSGTMDDVFTSADTKAQAIYLRTFQECFPLCGVIGEEDSFKIEPHADCGAYFTVDPLDGTKAYVRRQSHGVSSMVSLVCHGEVIAAYVGDINTEEVYGFRPGSSKVHRITRMDTAELLGAGDGAHVSTKYALLRNPADRYSSAVQSMLSEFKSYEVIGSSIGTWMAQLWKREVAAVFMEPGWETPWDSTPIIGISQKLGYVFLRPENGHWVEYTPLISPEKYRREHETMIVHPNDLAHLAL